MTPLTAILFSQKMGFAATQGDREDSTKEADTRVTAKMYELY